MGRDRRAGAQPRRAAHPSRAALDRRQARKAPGVEVIGDIELFAREIGADAAHRAPVDRHHRHQRQIDHHGADRPHPRGRRASTRRSAAISASRRSALSPPRRRRVYVLEMSSYQIDLTPRPRPRRDVLSNITPDHIDRHGTMENYVAVKARIFASQRKGDTGVSASTTHWSRRSARAAPANRRATVLPVSVGKALAAASPSLDGVLSTTARERRRRSIDLARQPHLPGAHNWQNAPLAYAAAAALGVDARRSPPRIAAFPGLAHRMEEVGRIGGIALRQRFQGHQCRRRGEGAGLLRPTSSGSPAACRRKAASRRWRRSSRISRGAYLIGEAANGLRRHARRQGVAYRMLRHAGEGGGRRAARAARTDGARRRWCCCRRPAPPSTSSPISSSGAMPSSGRLRLQYR